MPSLSLMLLCLASQTLGWSRPQLEPGHAIRVIVVSSDPLQIGPCVVLGSGAWHLELLPITTHCRRTAYETSQPQKTIRMLIPSGLLCCSSQRANNRTLTNSAVIIGSYALRSSNATRSVSRKTQNWKCCSPGLTWPKTRVE